MRIRLIAPLLCVASLPTSVSAQQVQPWARTFALGVNSGLASVQAYERPAEIPNHCYNEPAAKLFQTAMEDIQVLVDALWQEGVAIDRPPHEWGENCVRPPDPLAVEAWRTATQVKINHQSEFKGHIYSIGINIGIAEAQASLGESRRQLVYMALQNAQAGAKAAFHTDITGLDECILLAGGTTPMPEIHKKIVLARTRFQAEWVITPR